MLCVYLNSFGIPNFFVCQDSHSFSCEYDCCGHAWTRNWYKTTAWIILVFLIYNLPHSIPVATSRACPPWDKSDVTLWAQSSLTFNEIESCNKSNVPLQISSTVEHGLYDSVSAIDVTHNHITSTCMYTWWKQSFDADAWIWVHLTSKIWLWNHFVLGGMMRQRRS